MIGEFAEKIYNINKTAAFPANKRIVEQVSELKAMKEALDSAAIGDIVPFYIGKTGIEDTVVYEKISTRMWQVTRLREADGQIKVVGGRSKIQGLDLLKSFADKHYRSFDSLSKFSEAYEQVYRSEKEKQ